MKRVCVYCGSNPGFNPLYAQAAEELGSAISCAGFELVYGGSDVGLMRIVADAVIKAGNNVIGIIPEAFADKVSHRGLVDLRIVPSMHERKKMMFELSDAFVALPGGLGTIEELTELLTWAQLGLHEKPCGLINVAGYYDRFLSFLDHAVGEGFIKQEHRNALLVSDAPEALLKQFMCYRAPSVEKWLAKQARPKG